MYRGLKHLDLHWICSPGFEIDEIADFANIKSQIADITERAMDGELNFDLALIERVGLLEGLNVEVLERVYKDRLQINPGGKELINFLKSKSIKIGLVSGGFTYFTEQLSKDSGLDYSLANTLSIKDEKLTGKINGPIVNATAKADFVLELCEINSVSTDSVIVAGDGANDLEQTVHVRDQRTLPLCPAKALDNAHVGFKDLLAEI